MADFDTHAHGCLRVGPVSSVCPVPAWCLSTVWPVSGEQCLPRLSKFEFKLHDTCDDNIRNMITLHGHVRLGRGFLVGGMACLYLSLADRV